ncbi:MAG: hypothetical protein AAGH78_00680 [Cyanobacteria bacterium P01_H01_bin.58]
MNEDHRYEVRTELLDLVQCLWDTDFTYQDLDQRLTNLLQVVGVWRSDDLLIAAYQELTHARPPTLSIPNDSNHQTPA